MATAAQTRLPRLTGSAPQAAASWLTSHIPRPPSASSSAASSRGSAAQPSWTSTTIRRATGSARTLTVNSRAPLCSTALVTNSETTVASTTRLSSSSRSPQPVTRPRTRRRAAGTDEGSLTTENLLL
ncbi:hypothetical protein RLT57_13025 [Streptomyces sp. ITFR-21]|nr:hypothetical protein [Streptomyces sp. ITFR-21]WNI16353.1 hypothetical protein RLT57_13025 [Streptomyces sp. ITFR-21]